MKLTKHKLSILALAVILLLSLTAFFGINSLKADASGTVTVSKANVFTADEDYQVLSGAVGEGDDAKYYTTFTFRSDDDVVSYRRNLAYYWWQSVAAEDDGDGEEAQAEDSKALSAQGEEGYFNMNIGFTALGFEKFYITFESQEYNKTKDGKSINYVIFFPAGEANTVYALITSDKDAELEDGKTYEALDMSSITVKFTEKLSGAYAVTVEDESGHGETGEFENVGGTYAKASTSSSSPLYPLAFSANFEEVEEGEEGQEAKMVLYSLNGQSFEMKDGSATTVTDNAPPVLCLNEEVRYFTAGSAPDIDFVVIDVLRTSPTSTVYYYVLTWDDYDGGSVDFNDTEVYKEVSTDMLFESDIDVYLPLGEQLAGTAFNAYNADGELDKLAVDMLVKLYVNLSDYSSETYKETADICLDWYVNDNYLVKINENVPFMAVAKDELGVTYAYDNDDKTGWSTEADGLIAQYQAEVDKLAKNLSAGSSSYLYLPSPEKLFKDNATAYTDMTLSIYYYHDSQTSNTGLKSSNLSINITNLGKYKFTIYATDAAGNNMYYLDDGKVKEFEASEIWDMFSDKDNGLYDKLPWFDFTVGYTGVSFEETPGLQSTAYVGTSYSSASFKINGISGTYETKYRLFIFDRSEYYEATGITYSYEEFVDVVDKLFNNELFTDELLTEMLGADKFAALTEEQLSDYKNTRKYFSEIPVVTESDADYETYKDYEWSNSSTTFTPQVANAFYYIRAEVTDNYNGSPVTCGLAVVASDTANSLKGESDWLKNNVASVVLLSIAGVAFIGIILLLVIKPKNKEDIDVEFEKKAVKKNKK